MASSSSSSLSLSLSSQSNLNEMRSELSNLLNSINVIGSKIKQFEDKCVFDDIETEKQVKDMRKEIEQIYQNKRIKSADAYDVELKLAEDARSVANRSLAAMVMVKEENRLKEEAITFEEELIASMKEDLSDKERQFQLEFKLKMSKLLQEEEKEQAERLNRVLQTHKTEIGILKEMV